MNTNNDFDGTLSRVEKLLSLIERSESLGIDVSPRIKQQLETLMSRLTTQILEHLGADRKKVSFSEEDAFVVEMAKIAIRHMRENNWQAFDLTKLRKINSYKKVSTGVGRHLNTSEAIALIKYLKAHDFVVEIKPGLYRFNR